MLAPPPGAATLPPPAVPLQGAPPAADGAAGVVVAAPEAAEALGFANVDQTSGMSGLVYVVDLTQTRNLEAALDIIAQGRMATQRRAQGTE